MNSSLKVTLNDSKPAKRRSRELGSRMQLSESTKALVLEAAGYGMPADRIAILCGFPGNQTQWHRWIAANPDFQAELGMARAKGELDLQRQVIRAGVGWQAAGWMLERTRGYTARTQLEHSGRDGKALSVSGVILGAFGAR